MKIDTPVVPVFRSGTRVSDCYCDSLLTNDKGEVVFLSLFGTFNSVRAVWARLIEGLSVEILGESYKLGTAKFSKIRAPLGDGLLHTVFVAEAATEQPSQASYFYQLGPDSDKLFFPRLDRYSSVPFPRGSQSLLWQSGVKRGLITELDGFGIEGYQVVVKDSVWSAIAMENLKG